MNRKKLACILLLLLLTILSLNGCGQKKLPQSEEFPETENVPAQTPETTDLPTQEPAPTATATPNASDIPTDTPSPAPTSTPEPVAVATDAPAHVPDFTAAPTAQPTEAPIISDGTDWYQHMLNTSILSEGTNGRLEKVLEKIRTGEKVSIMALGGSVTEGAGAKNFSYSYGEQFVFLKVH